MKKFILAVALAFAAVCGAQAEGLYVGGQLGYWHDSDDDDVNASTNTLSILPEVGYNLNDNWAIGTTIGYSYKHVCGADLSSHHFQLAPYARYTFFKSSNNLVNLFVDGGVGFGAGWVSAAGEESSTACTWNVGLKPGIAINLTEKFSVVAHVGMLGYQGANNAAKTVGYHNQGGLLLDNNNLSLGFYFNF